jgi:parallel beta-helix repeat protein
MPRLSRRNCFGPHCGSPSKHQQPRRVKLSLECLEDRAVPATLHVGTNPHEYATIQAAINAAGNGDHIKVDPGVYTEQIVINKSVDLEGQGGGGNPEVIVKAPAMLTSGLGTGGNAIIEVTGAHNVEIEHLTITGPGNPQAVGNLKYGILVDGGASVEIAQNHITSIEDAIFGASPFGVAIDVGNAADSADSSLGATTGTADIENNTIDNYQRAGIVVSNVGSAAFVNNNHVSGVGPTTAISQEGVEVSALAVAQVTNNWISGNTNPDINSAAGTGILFENPGMIRLPDYDSDPNDFFVAAAANNKITGNDVGIYVVNAGLQATDQPASAYLNNNQVSNNVFDGIVLDTSSGVQVNNNQLFGNGSANAGDGGIYLTGANGNLLNNNQAKNNNGSGIFLDATSTGNALKNNQATGNVYDVSAPNADVVDLSAGNGTGGTANTWVNNQGKTYIDSSGISLFHRPQPHHNHH